MAYSSGWTVRYASKAVRREMRQQPESIRTKFDHIFGVIERKGLDEIPNKYKEKIREGLWEMRVSGRDAIARSLYLKRDGMRVIIVCVFKKDTPKIEHRYIQLALQRAKEYDNG
ncbi:MAG: type II toxin-antitoxin system RelE/ParE family toxin [Proteobacteria bacterium]|nr:type II toxin-antitoxin system RelE/ParE family toxin [Pseudomonadota bacterium]